MDRPSETIPSKTLKTVSPSIQTLKENFKSVVYEEDALENRETLK